MTLGFAMNIELDEVMVQDVSDDALEQAAGGAQGGAQGGGNPSQMPSVKSVCC